MPLGLQIIGRQRDDFGVLDAMLGMERVFDFNERASFPNG